MDATTRTTRACGFYATGSEVFYATPAGRLYAVSSSDFDGIREVAGLPGGAASCDGLLTPAEAVDYCRQVEAESGETLVEEAE